MTFIERLVLLALVILSGVLTVGCKEPATESSQRGQGEVRLTLSPAQIMAQNRDSVFLLEVLDEDAQILGSGTAFVAIKPTWLWTNAHVVENGITIRARTHAGAFFEIEKVLALDNERDLAVLEIRAKGLKPCTIASAAPSEGDTCVVIGSPLGLDTSVSTGVVASLSRPSGGTTMQITAPISPGSSGSPVFSDLGEVVGVATMSARAGQNVNLAMNYTEIQALAEEVRDNAREGVDLSSRPVDPFDRFASEHLVDLPEARRLPLLNDFLKENPANLRAILEKSDCLNVLRLHRENIEFLTKVLSQEIESAKIYRSLAASLSWLEAEPSLVIEAAQKARSLDSENVESWIHVAQQQRNYAKDPVAAIMTLKQALRQLCPPDAQHTKNQALAGAAIRRQLAFSHEKMENWPSAIQNLKWALDLYESAAKLGHKESPLGDQYSTRSSLADLYRKTGEGSLVANILTELIAPFVKDGLPDRATGMELSRLEGAVMELLEHKLSLDMSADVTTEIDLVLEMLEAFGHNGPWAGRDKDIARYMLMLKDFDRFNRLVGSLAKSDPKDPEWKMLQAHGLAWLRALGFLAKGNRDSAEAEFRKSNNYGGRPADALKAFDQGKFDDYLVRESYLMHRIRKLRVNNKPDQKLPTENTNSGDTNSKKLGKDEDVTEIVDPDSTYTVQITNEKNGAKFVGKAFLRWGKKIVKGGYRINGADTLYHLVGELNEDGTIDLQEKVNGVVSATGKITATTVNGKIVWKGRLKNTDDERTFQLRLTKVK
ncbi:trypsin-like peptidase domain-containing protein [Akkermansiaceae bacterium]|nr:trypsin-like peptidase domain-containing protein [Akkermansiaceae bacterium]